MRKLTHPRKGFADQHVVDADALLAPETRGDAKLQADLTCLGEDVVKARYMSYRVVFHNSTDEHKRTAIIKHNKSDEPLVHIVGGLAPTTTAAQVAANKYPHVYGELLAAEPIHRIPAHTDSHEFYVMVNRAWVRVTPNRGSRDRKAVSYSVFDGTLYINGHFTVTLPTIDPLILHTGAPVFITTSPDNFVLVGVVGRRIQGTTTYPILGPAETFERTVPLRGDRPGTHNIPISVFESVSEHTSAHEKELNKAKYGELCLDVGLNHPDRMANRSQNARAIESTNQLLNNAVIEETRLYIHDGGDRLVMACALVKRTSSPPIPGNVTIYKIWTDREFGRFSICYKSNLDQIGYISDTPTANYPTPITWAADKLKKTLLI